MKKLMVGVAIAGALIVVPGARASASGNVLGSSEAVLAAAIGQLDDGEGEQPQRGRGQRTRRRQDGQGQRGRRGRGGQQGQDGERGRHRRQPHRRRGIIALLATQDEQLGTMLDNSVALTGELHDLMGQRHEIFAAVVTAAKTGDREKVKEAREGSKELAEKMRALHKKLAENSQAIAKRLKELSPQIQDQLKEFRQQRGPRGENDREPRDDFPPDVDW